MVGARNGTPSTPADPLIRCPRCGNALGALVAGIVVIKHRGREIVGVPVSIRCEKCPGVWRPPDAALQAVVETEILDRFNGTADPLRTKRPA